MLTMLLALSALAGPPAVDDTEDYESEEVEDKCRFRVEDAGIALGGIGGIGGYGRTRGYGSGSRGRGISAGGVYLRMGRDCEDAVPGYYNPRRPPYAVAPAPRDPRAVYADVYPYPDDMYRSAAAVERFRLERDYLEGNEAARRLAEQQAEARTLEVRRLEAQLAAERARATLAEQTAREATTHAEESDQLLDEAVRVGRQLERELESATGGEE
jgi:hypothetical protein